MAVFELPKLAQSEILPLPNDTGALANRINDATRSYHNQINSLINLKIVFALRDYRIYRQGIQSFYHVFRTFEECWKLEMEKAATDEKKPSDGETTADIYHILSEVWTPAIARTEPLERDLDFYYANDRSKYQTPVMSEQVAFVEHIRKITAEKPHLLLAYGHVMYLALFAGGRILRSNIMKSTGLFPQIDGLTTEEVATKGTNLFRFQVDDEDNLRASFKTKFELQTRNNLTEQEKREIMEEAQEIFRRNIACISEIEKHNRQLVLRKYSYKAFKGAKILLLALVAFMVFFFLKRVAFTF